LNGDDERIRGVVTGQVDFDSHSSGVVRTAIELINLVEPGEAHGRPYTPPTGTALVDGVAALLKGGVRGEADLAELLGYTPELRTVFEWLADRELDAACECANGLLRSTAVAPVLSRHDGEPWHLHFHATGGTWAKTWAGSLCTAIAGVLGSPMWDRLGVCSAPACDRVYVDTSRNGTRRFCSTSCQNRVKAAAFRERSRP
jgi:CGNR zinc finger